MQQEELLAGRSRFSKSTVIRSSRIEGEQAPEPVCTLGCCVTCSTFGTWHAYGL